MPLRCNYCKSETIAERAIEHVIPESFGNPAVVLPMGWVCSDCNNYLGRKVEGPFLNSLFGRQSRSEMRVPNKRHIHPPATGIHLPSWTEIQLRDGSIWAERGGDEARLVKSLSGSGHGSFLLPMAAVPNNDYVCARFACKVGMNAYALALSSTPNGNKLVVDCEQLDAIREYVRRGKKNFVWPVQIRRLYAAATCFRDEKGCYEKLNETAILFLEDKHQKGYGEVYAVFAILGVEFVVNLGGPILDRYHDWQRRHRGASYLNMCTTAIEQDIDGK